MCEAMPKRRITRSINPRAGGLYAVRRSPAVMAAAPGLDRAGDMDVPSSDATRKLGALARRGLIEVKGFTLPRGEPATRASRDLTQVKADRRVRAHAPGCQPAEAIS